MSRAEGSAWKGTDEAILIFRDLAMVFASTLVGVVVAGKFAVWFGVVRLFGFPGRTALRVGLGLTQIGEFSFVLAQVALHARLIPAEVYNATLTASLVTILLNASLFKLLGPG